MGIPFFLPDISQQDIDAVVEVLRSGWITTGPKVQQFESELAAYTQCHSTVCMSSATAALEIALRIYGVGPGDEVITTPYTYAASANVILHLGAKPVFVDVAKDSFNIDPDGIARAITSKTKAIIPVDIAGFPCDYPVIQDVVKSKKSLFQAGSDFQEILGRPLILADAAHSFGARITPQEMSARYADMTAFSFHAVKNLTTAEGGALCFAQDCWSGCEEELVREARLLVLHGQNKDALSKQKAGQWRYDILCPGFKCNMTDIQAALGISQLARYEANLSARKEILYLYDQRLRLFPRAILPEFTKDGVQSSYHLYALRVAGCGEQERDALITDLAGQGITLNVHFQPLPLLSAYKNLGYCMEDYPHAYAQYENEISLPLYPTLTESQVDIVVQALSGYLGS